MNFFKTTVFSFLSLASTFALAQIPTQIRGLRVDPGYFYNTYPNKTAQQVAVDVVAKAKSARVNTLYLYAYNSVYGAYYPTTYSLTTVESGYGKLNIFKAVTDEAKRNGLAVIGVIPINDFKNVWNLNPAWRVKKKTGVDYKPFAEVFLLSAWHPDYRNWLTGFVNDFFAKNPTVDGVEAVEPTVDFYWNKASDYNTAATNAFLSRYPTGVLGDANWLKVRALGLTELIGIMNQRAHAYGKKSFVVQTWSAASTGKLFTSANLRDGMGFDFDGVMNLQGTQKMDYVMAEMMWQEAASEYGGSLFTPEWTRQAALEFIQKVNNRSIPIVHVEISPFSGAAGTYTPTLSEFARTLTSIRDLGVGVDVYDFNQLYTQSAWTSLSAW